MRVDPPIYWIDTDYCWALEWVLRTLLVIDFEEVYSGEYEVRF
jgi:hypothetical protein